MSEGDFCSLRRHGCPCGYYGDHLRTCRCTPPQIRQYQARISGPLLDRIDIHVAVPSVKYRELVEKHMAESSGMIKIRIEEARRHQRKRIPDSPFFSNARMNDQQLKAFCRLEEESQRLLEMAVDRLGLSARAYSRILKVARTIADLEGEADIHSPHIAEAIQYRTLDRTMI